jgi:hypothetical protein
VIGAVNTEVLIDDIKFNRIACYFGGESLSITKP